MKLQHDTHYLTRSLDVRYVVEDKVSPNFWSKHSIYNPNNIDNTITINKSGEAKYRFGYPDNIVLGSDLYLERDADDYIILQNFEFINYFFDLLCISVNKISTDLVFLSGRQTLPGCIKAKNLAHETTEIPMIALINDNDTLWCKLKKLSDCLNEYRIK